MSFGEGFLTHTLTYDALQSTRNDVQLRRKRRLGQAAAWRRFPRVRVGPDRFFVNVLLTIFQFDCRLRPTRRELQLLSSCRVRLSLIDPRHDLDPPCCRSVDPRMPPLRPLHGRIGRNNPGIALRFRDGEQFHWHIRCPIVPADPRQESQRQTRTRCGGGTPRRLSDRTEFDALSRLRERGESLA